MHIFALYHLLSKETIGQVFTVVGHQHCLQSVFVQLTSATHALLSCVKGWCDCYAVKHVIPLNTILLCFIEALAIDNPSNKLFVLNTLSQLWDGRRTDGTKTQKFSEKSHRGVILKEGFLSMKEKKCNKIFQNVGS